MVLERTALTNTQPNGNTYTAPTVPNSYCSSGTGVGTLTWELQELQQLASYRSGVMAEAMAQKDSIVQYFRGILGFNQRSFPATTFLMIAAARVGSFLSMYYKNMFNRPRPSSFSPGLFPPIDPPGHAAYPSGHATQAMLMALFLEQVMPGMGPTTQNGATTGLLRSMAIRIGRNREVLGVHYPSDSLAGRKLAQLAFLLMTNASVTSIMGTSTDPNRRALTTYPSEFTTGGQSLTAYSSGLLYLAYQEWN